MKVPVSMRLSPIRNTYFQFSQFRINQDKCGMKVTSDASVLGALVEVEQSRKLLDIGAGTGLLSLMAAQRSSATITAVELDDGAAEQARENFLQSPWHDRLTLDHCAIQDFSDGEYDTIICNPPFFNNSSKAPCAQRSMARHTDSLSFYDLATHIDRLLAPLGKAWVLLPTEEAELFLKVVEQNTRLLPHQRITLRPSEHKPAHRMILVLGRQEVSCIEQMLTMYNGSEYDQQVRSLLAPYYLYLSIDE